MCHSEHSFVPMSLVNVWMAQKDTGFLLVNINHAVEGRAVYVYCVKHPYRLSPRP